MPELHPGMDLLEQFIRGELDAGASRGVVRHLVTGCPLCLATTRRLWSQAPPQEGYDAAFARLLDRYGATLERLAAEREAAPGLLDELLRQPPARRVALVCADSRFRSLPLCERLIDRVRDAEPPETPETIEAAELALAVADRLDEQGAGPALVRGAQARAWAWLGNARRLAADLPGAQRALDTAELLVVQAAAAGVADPLEEAEVLALAAQLHAEQRQPRHLDEAAARFDRAAALYRAAGERHLRGRLLIQKGMALGEEALRQSALGRIDFGQPGWGLTAVAALQQGLGLAGGALERPLRIRALAGLVTLLLEAGRPEETLEPLRELRRLHEEDGDGLALVRLRRLEGKSAEALGRFDEAEAALMEARAGFLGKRMGPEAAYVSVELAVVYARRGRDPEMRRLSDDMSPVYLAGDVTRDVVSALIVFQRLAERDPGNLAFLIEIARFLGGSARLRRSLRPLQWVS